MKLDPAALRYLTNDDFRVLTAVEMGMRNHELVPIPLISNISGLRHGGYMRSLKQVHKNKLVHKESKRYVGYRLTTLGYDYLALRALVKRGVLQAIGRPLGVGKEADVFMVTPSEELTEEDEQLSESPLLAMKLHRLGRTSFRAVKSKRDYLVHRKAASWIYLSRLAAIKEYAFMCALHQRGFPVPRPYGQSRNIVVMQLCPGVLLTQVHELDNAVDTANELLNVAVRLAKHGLIHCDLNEFNILVDDEDGSITVIDFPQMVSTAHVDAEMLFDRDVDGIRRFFSHRFGVKDDEMIRPTLSELLKERDDEDRIDSILAASGFKNVDQDGQYGEQDLTLNEGEPSTDGAEQLGLDLIDLQCSVLGKDIPGTEDELSPATETGQTVDEEGNENTTPETNLANNVGDENDGDNDNDGDDDGDENNDDGEVNEVDVDKSTQFSDAGSSLNHAAIEARVRRQRANQKQRRQFAKRNTIKDSEKRKIKVEVGCEMWR